MDYETRITARQLYVLMFRSRGFSQAEVATKLGVSESNVSAIQAKAIANVFQDAARQGLPTVPGDTVIEVVTKLAYQLGYLELMQKPGQPYGETAYQVHPRYRYLTVTQLSMLADVASGLTPKQVLAKRCVTRNTYITTMRRIRKTLKANTTTHAVAIAFAHRILNEGDLT